MKLKIIASRAYTYPNQINPQDRYFQIFRDGRITVDVNPEIGNAIPVKVWSGIIRRLTIPDGYSRSDILSFYKTYKGLFQRVVDGMGEKYDGNNYVGILSDDAKEAEGDLSHTLYTYTV